MGLRDRSEVNYSSLILLFLLTVGTSSCADLSAYRYWQTYAMVQPGENYNREYQDKNLAFRFEISDKKIRTLITNKTEHDIKLLWSKVKFIEITNVTV